MKRGELAHVLRAATTITDDPGILVVGSQAILGSFSEDELPEAATRSIDVDVVFFDDPDEAKSDAVDGAIGELSAFHEPTGTTGRGWEPRPRSFRRDGKIGSFRSTILERIRAERSVSMRMTWSFRSSSPAARRISSSTKPYSRPGWSMLDGWKRERASFR